MQIIQTVAWAPDGVSVRVIDQRKLPGEYVERDLRDEAEVVEAIRTLTVRGAPAIGICGAMGLVTALAPHVGERGDAFLRRLTETAGRIRAARPTAVNLPWALDRMCAVAESFAGDNTGLLARLRDEASAILAEATHRLLP